MLAPEQLVADILQKELRGIEIMRGEEICTGAAKKKTPILPLEGKTLNDNQDNCT